MKLTMKRKFSLLFIPFGLLGLIIGVLTVRGLSVGSTEIRNSHRTKEAALEAHVHVLEMSEHMKALMLNPSDTKEADLKKKADDDLVQVLTELKSMVKDELKVELVALAEFDEKKLNPAEDQVNSLVKAWQREQALNYYLQTYTPLREEYNKMITAILGEAQKATDQEIERMSRDIAQTQWAILITLAGGILSIAGFLVVWSKRTSETLERVTNGMIEVSGFLNHTSAELSDSSRKLSDSSNSQASALQETVSAVDQINAMVGKNSENSSQTRLIAGQSELAAKEGKQVVDQMRDSIAEISSSNTEVMARLEKSNKELFEIVTVISEIGTKTKVINDIVFQTKLLSFNASVEAARAGEHGKGFAVVAEEVGNLAQMSGQASIEISKMLDEGVERVKLIVEATSREIGALLAEGRDKVDHGMVTAQMAGESIEQLLLNIGKVTLMVDEVAVASKEQAQGLQEVAIAMGKLEQVTQANTLVAQSSETTAQELESRTDEIESIVNDLFEIVHGEKRRHAKEVVSTSIKEKAISNLDAA